MLESLVDLDRSLFVLLNQRWTAGWLDQPMMTITNGKILQILAVCCLALATIRLRWKAVPLILGLLTAVAVSNSSSDIIKSLVDRPRPFVTEESMRLLVGKGRVASFPSSHAANGAAVAAAAITLLGLGSFRRRILGVGLVVLTVVVGWSRIYTGAHYPLDVLSGWLLGSVAGLSMALLWKQHPPLREAKGPWPLKWDIYHGAIMVSLVLAIFRLAQVATSDQGLTPGEAIVWYAAKYPVLDLRETLGPTPPFMSWLVRLLGADQTYEVVSLRWIMPLVGLLAILGLMGSLRLTGLSRSVCGMVILFLQSLPAINACHVWFTENMFNGLPWVLSLGGWAHWTLRRKPVGLVMVAVSLMVVGLTDPRSALIILTSLWLLEHFRGDYVSRPATWKSLVVGLGLMAGSLTYRFYQPHGSQDELWSWSIWSMVMAAGPGTVILTVIGLAMIVVHVLWSWPRLDLLGTRGRIILLYGLGTALASIWLGSKAHVVAVVPLTIPGLLLVSQSPLIQKVIRQQGFAGVRLFVFPIFITLCLGLNSASLFLIYDKDTIRRIPGHLVEPRWISGLPDRLRPLEKALLPEDRLVAPDFMTAAALSHALRRPVGRLQIWNSINDNDSPVYLVHWVDGSTSTLNQEIVAMAPWSVARLRQQMIRWDNGPGALVPAQDGIPSVLPLDKLRTVRLDLYQKLTDRDPVGEAPVTSMDPMVTDPAAP